MRLVDLQATFIRVRMEPADESIGRRLPDGTTQWGGFLTAAIWPVPNRQGAHGVKFLCPRCYTDDPDPYTHPVMLFFAGVDVPGEVGRNAKGIEVRWTAEGYIIDELTLSPSVSVQGDCHSHFFVRGGGVDLA